MQRYQATIITGMNIGPSSNQMLDYIPPAETCSNERKQNNINKKIQKCLKACELEKEIKVRKYS